MDSIPPTHSSCQSHSQTAAPLAAATLIYRKAPSGLGNAKVTLRQNGSKLFSLTLTDEYGDVNVVLDSTHIYSQDDGTYDVDARYLFSNPAKQYNRRVNLTARLGHGKDAATEIWVLDGSVKESVDSCRHFDATQTSLCIDKLYRDVPGQFSFKVATADASVKSLSNGMIGDFTGWFQQDKFGTGLADGTTQTAASPSATPGNTTVTAPVPPQTFSKTYTGTAASFRGFLIKACVNDGDPLYVSMLGRVMRTSNDTVQIKDGAFPYCGNVQIKVIPIPLLDGATAAEKVAFSYDSALAVSTKYSVLAIEDEALPGSPAMLAKARDALGFVRTHVFLIESRYVDPTTFVGGKCLDGNSLPPQFPLNAGLPTLPAGTAYFRGDIAPLQSALKTSANKITLVDANMTSIKVVELNPATLHLDADTKAAMAANVDDPSIGYVLLGLEGKAGSPKLTNAMPTALLK